MELVPPYLAAYLWRIRKHSGEIGYFKRALAPKDIEAAVYEKSMLSELEKLHLVTLTDEEDEVLYEPSVTEPDGTTYHLSGDTQRTTVPRGFLMLARGHWLWTEYVFVSLRWLVTAALGGFIGNLIALAVSNAAD